MSNCWRCEGTGCDTHAEDCCEAIRAISETHPCKPCRACPTEKRDPIADFVRSLYGETGK